MGKYTEEEKQEACQTVFGLMSEGRSVRSILDAPDKSPGLPTRATFTSWIDNDDDLLNQYMRARDKRADAIFEDMMAISDDGTNDRYTVETPSGPVERVDHDVVQRSRLRVETRKWMLGKMNSKKYGDRKVVEIEEADNKIDLSNLSDEEAEALEALIKKSKAK